METNSFISRNFSALILRSSRVSQPCTVFPAAQRFWPSAVIGPLLLPPCILQTCLPLTAAFLHCSCDRLDLAWQRGAGVFLPKRLMCLSYDLCMENHTT